MPRDLQRSPEVLQLAHSLGMKGRWADPVEHLRTFCMRTLNGWAAQFQPTTLDELLDTALSKLGVQVREIERDSDLEEICDHYVQAGELGFEKVRKAFDDQTFALVVRLITPANGCTHVAVIDCRGAKTNRRWFSKWHEIAHLLTMPQLEFSFRRCGAHRADALEQMMDLIAGDLAFYAPLHRIGISAAGQLTFEALETLRETSVPGSSREAAYANAVQRLPFPALFVVADRGLKASEERSLGGRSAYWSQAAAPLRAIRVVQSESGGILIPRNMRVPAKSVITLVFERETVDLAVRTLAATENLDWWVSEGRPLSSNAVRVEAGRCGKRVFALIVRNAA